MFNFDLIELVPNTSIGRVKLQMCTYEYNWSNIAKFANIISLAQIDGLRILSSSSETAENLSWDQICELGISRHFLWRIRKKAVLRSLPYHTQFLSGLTGLPITNIISKFYHLQSYSYDNNVNYTTRKIEMMTIVVPILTYNYHVDPNQPSTCQRALGNVWRFPDHGLRDVTCYCHYELHMHEDTFVLSLVMTLCLIPG